MNERPTDVRDVWLSRGHFQVAVVGALLFGLLCFSVGVLVGRQGVGEAAPPRAEALVSSAPGEELVELLAEVERGAMINASKQVIYQDVLERRASAAVPEAPPPMEGLGSKVPPKPGEATFVGDAPRDGRYTVEIGVFQRAEEAAAIVSYLKEHHLDAWMTQRRVGGQAQYRVGVGSFDEQTHAEPVATLVAQRMRETSATLGAPAVVSLRP